MDSSDHGIKSDPNGIFLSYFQRKKISPKINQNRVANNDFDLQNDCNEDRLSFLVYGEKINLSHFRPFLRFAVLKVQNFCQN
jgi:hypothetical protein